MKNLFLLLTLALLFSCKKENNFRVFTTIPYYMDNAESSCLKMDTTNVMIVDPTTYGSYRTCDSAPLIDFDKYDVLGFYTHNKVIISRSISEKNNATVYTIVDSISNVGSSMNWVVINRSLGTNFSFVENIK